MGVLRTSYLADDDPVKATLTTALPGPVPESVLLRPNQVIR